MDGRPGKEHQGRSYHTEKFVAGRGRILKEHAKRSPKAEEVARRRNIQQLLLSGKVPLDQKIENNLGRSTRAGSSSSASSSSSQLQSADSDRETTTGNSKTPLEVTHCDSENQWNTNNCNNLEEKFQNLQAVDSEEGSDNDIPPRFRKSPWGKTFRMHSKKNRHANHRHLKDFNNHMKPQKVQPSNLDVARTQEGSSNAWVEWEASVVIPGSVNEEDIKELAVVEDNDDLNDVIVSQYVSALHQDQNGLAPIEAKPGKITPSRVQQFSKLKSTLNADLYKLPPGTIPKPPKGLDRWGGTELKSADTPTGWGDIPEEESGNWYDDGSKMWSGSNMSYTAGTAWSWNS